VHVDRVVVADPGVVVLVVVPGVEALAEGAGVLDRAESAGEVGAVLERVLDFIELPRPAWRVRVPSSMWYLRVVWPMRCLARWADSRWPIIQPTT
jgi:hypothetical protein